MPVAFDNAVLSHRPSGHCLRPDLPGCFLVPGEELSLSNNGSALRDRFGPTQATGCLPSRQAICSLIHNATYKVSLVETLCVEESAGTKDIGLDDPVRNQVDAGQPDPILVQ